MGWRRDRIANEKIIDFMVPAIYPIGANPSAIVDLRNAPAVVGAPGGGAGREIHTNILFQLSIGAHDAAAGWTFQLEIFTGDVATTMTSYAITALVAQAGADDLYLIEIRDLQRYMQTQLTVANHAFLCCLLGNAERSRREPVFQLGTELAVTYNKNPALPLTGP